MQLNDVDIPNSDKLKIMSKVDEKIPNLGQDKISTNVFRRQNV